MSLLVKFPFLSVAVASAVAFSGAVGAQEITGAGATFPAPIYAKDGSCVFKTVFNQNGRRTGAGFFVGSGAVCDDPLGLIEFAKA